MTPIGIIIEWYEKVFDTIQKIFVTPLRSLAARFFWNRKKKKKKRNPNFLNRENFFFPFWLFWWFPFLSLLSKRNNILIKNKNTKRHNKKGKVPSSIERRLFGLFLLSYFSISATHSRSFVCSRQIVEEKKESSFFCLFQRRRKGREKRGRETQKKALLFLSLFLIEKAKTSFARVPKKQEEEEEEKKQHKKGEEDKRWCRDTFWFKWRTRWIVIDSLRIYPSRGELWTRVLTFYEAHEPRHFL